MKRITSILLALLCLAPVCTPANDDEEDDYVENCLDDPEANCANDSECLISGEVCSDCICVDPNWKLTGDDSETDSPFCDPAENITEVSAASPDATTLVVTIKFTGDHGSYFVTHEENASTVVVQLDTDEDFLEAWVKYAEQKVIDGKAILEVDWSEDGTEMIYTFTWLTRSGGWAVQDLNYVRVDVLGCDEAYATRDTNEGACLPAASAVNQTTDWCDAGEFEPLDCADYADVSEADCDAREHLQCVREVAEATDLEGCTDESALAAYNAAVAACLVPDC